MVFLVQKKKKVVGVRFGDGYMNFGHYYLRRCSRNGKRCKIKWQDVRVCREVVEKGTTRSI